MAAVGDRLTRLIFTLPAELRNEIYALALPITRPHVPITQSHPQLRWLASSKELFADAAAMFYGSSCFYHGIRLSAPNTRKTLAQLLEQHVHSNYVGLDQAWMIDTAGKLIKELVLDLRMAYEQVEDLPGRLHWYLADFAKRLPNLEKLYIFFGPDFMATDIGTVHVRNDFERLKRKWMRPEEYAGGGHFTKSIAVVDELCLQDCEIKWRVSGQFNVFDTAKPLKTS